MKPAKLKALVFAALVLACLLILFFAYRYCGRSGAGSAAPPAAEVSPAKPAVRAVIVKKNIRGKIAAKKGEGFKKPGGRRKPRVSRLREPGEALGGGKETRHKADAL